MSFLSHLFATVSLPFIVVAGFFGYVQNPAPIAVPIAAIATSTINQAAVVQAILGATTSAPTPTISHQTSVAPTKPDASGIYCAGKYFNPCEGVGAPVCLSDNSNAYCRPPQSRQIIPAQSGTQSPAPQYSNPPANATYCNGKYWNRCTSGQFYCPASGPATCVPDYVSQLQQLNQQLQAQQQAQQTQTQQYLQQQTAQQQALMKPCTDWLALIESNVQAIKSEVTSAGGTIDASQLQAMAISRSGRAPTACYSEPMPTAICSDGTASYSFDNSGTCSWHGGVDVWLY